MTAMKKSFSLLALAIATMTGAPAQTVVYNDNFSVSQGTNYASAGNIGTSSWTVARSGDDWGARIDSGVMTLINDIGAVSNSDGWVYSYQTLASSGAFNTTFADSAGPMTWTFNMRQLRTNPASFTAGNYGVAWVVGASSTLVATQGSGYAVVLGNTGTPDPLRFVSFTGGLQALGNPTNALITASAPLSNPTNNFMSIRLTYNPSSNLWELFGRDDGTSAFSDPNVGTLTLLGSATNSTYTDQALTSSGAYWQGATAANQWAQFDNARLEVVPEPGTCALLALSAVCLAVYRWRCRVRR
jgi:hypothetical protein